MGMQSSGKWLQASFGLLPKVLVEVRGSAIVTWGTLLQAPGWRVSLGLRDRAGRATEHSNIVGPWMGWDSPPISLCLHPWAYYPQGNQQCQRETGRNE